MSRNHSITIRLSAEEKEWIRRKAYWEGQTTAELLRTHIQYLIKDEGYLRPPDDEPQDFGFEKEMMQFTNGLANDD